MRNKLTKQLLDYILHTKWEIEVRRPGFIQSKMIVLEAEAQPLPITPSVTLGYTTSLWVNDINPYRQDRLDNFPTLFTQAFEEDPTWPEKIMGHSNRHTRELKKFVRQIDQKWDNKTVQAKSTTFSQYIALLKDIQQFYIVAVPLAQYCEKELDGQSPQLLEFAIPYRPLDVDQLQQSLEMLRDAKENKADNLTELIQSHIQNFGWIKAAYNILSPYTQQEVLQEIASLRPSITRPKTTNRSPFLKGLQVGIYLRNHIKEASQQLWYSFEPLAQSIAQDLEISRDHFFQMLTDEIFLSMEKGHAVVSSEEIAKRTDNFIGGFIEGEELFVIDPLAKEIEDFLLKDNLQHHNKEELRGQIACRGKVSGVARVILNQADFTRLQPGDILITPMTTPDFVPLMKKAGAIVTNEGGIASHAAIISRELGIPCIIGTKVATEVVKDDDIVEVDAFEGIVRIKTIN